MRLRTTLALLAVIGAGSGAANDPLPLEIGRLVPGRDSFEILVQGAPLGYSATGIEDIPGGKRLTEHSSIGGLVEQTTTIEIGSDGAMRTVRQSGKVQNEPTTISLDYVAGRVKGSASTVSPEGPKSVTIDTAVAAGTVDDNAIQGLLPALPWSPDATWTFPVFSGGQNETRVTTLKVLGTEPVALNGATVETYKVEWTGGWQPATFWITTATPHRLVKIGIANTPVQIIRVR